MAIGAAVWGLSSGLSGLLVSAGADPNRPRAQPPASAAQSPQQTAGPDANGESLEVAAKPLALWGATDPSQAMPAALPTSSPPWPRHPPPAPLPIPAAAANPADALAESFRARSQGAFTVRFEGPQQTDLAYTVLDALNQVRDELRNSLRIVVGRSIEVVIYSEAQYRSGVRGPDWSPARFDGKIRITESHLDESSDTLRAILTHEYAHAILSVGSGVPAWFHEGVAQYLEPGGRDQDLWMVREAARSGQLIPFARLTTNFSTIGDAKSARLAYAEARDLIAFMIAERGEDRLHGVIRALAAGSPFPPSFASAFGSPEDFGRRWSDTRSAQR